MTNHHYPTLLVAALAATFIGAAIAQTQSDDASRMPANKGMAQESQTQPSTDQTDKMKAQEQGGSMKSQGQSDRMKEQPSSKEKPSDQLAMKSDQSAKTGKNTREKTAMADQKANTGKSAEDESTHAAQASHKSMKHGTKSKRQTEEAAAPDEKAYREALRDCVKQQDESQRDSCLDGAIEKFHRNA
jgi:hypothetical protein